MTPENIFLKFNKHFSASELDVLIPALRQEPVVWDFVVNNLDSLLENPLFDKLNQWTPERMGIYALGYLRKGNTPIDKATQKAISMAEVMEKPVTRVTDLLQAATIAFSALEPGVDTEKQAKIVAGFLSKPDFMLDGWGKKSVFACLPFALAQSGEFWIEHKLHNALCQPISDEELSIHVSTSILKLDTAKQIEALRFLAKSGRNNLVQLVADQIAADNPSEKTGDLASIAGASQRALIFQAAQRTEKASALLEESINQLEQYRIKLSEQQSALDFNNLAAFADDGDDGIGADLTAFNQALADGDVSTARKLGQLVSTKFVQRVASEKSLIRIPEHLLDVRPEGFINQLQDIGLDQDALQVAILFLKERPADSELLKTTCLILESLGDYSSAISYAEIAASVDAHSSEMQKKLASLYTASKNYEGAYGYWKNIVQSSSNTDIESQIGYAEAALLTDRNEEVITSCQTALKTSPENSKAQYLLGMAHFNLGNHPSALDALNTAVYLDPENQEAWLKLAESYDRVGEDANALDALRRAGMSNPESVEINYSLADKLLSAGLPSESLPYLEKCVNLAPKNPETAVKLGRTLCSLGKLGEAEQILSGAFQKWPENSVVSSAFSDTLLAAGKKFSAIKPMEVFINAGSVTIEQLMNYIDCLLDLDIPVYERTEQVSNENLGKAITALERVISEQPEHNTARMVLAEATLINGESTFAKKIYERLIENKGSYSSYNARINVGLGLACMQLNEFETAIAIFQETTQELHENLFLHQKLAEAFEQMNLNDEAMQTAEYALRIAPAEVRNLNWYAKLAERLGRLGEAISAYESAAELNPDNPEFALNTARLMIQNGEGESAKMWLDQAIQNPAMKASDFQVAAYSFLRLQDANSGYTCLEKAVETCENPTSDMLLEFTALTRSLFGDEKALDVLSKGLSVVPATRQLLTYQADIFHAIKNDQQALNLLQKAKKLSDLKDAEESNSAPRQYLMTTSWMESLSSEEGINARISSMYFNQGNIAAGLDVLQGMLSSTPDDLAIRTKAIEAAFNLLDFEKVNELKLDKVLDLETVAPDAQPDVEDYLALQAEIALHLGKIDEASMRLDQLITLDPSLSRVKVLQARLLQIKGDEKVARIAFQDAMKASVNEWKVLKKDEEWLAGLSTVSKQGWLADAAIELGFHDLAIHLCEEACRTQPGSALNQLRVIHSYAQATYVSKLRNELYVVTNTVDQNAINEGLERITTAYDAAKEIKLDPEIEKWFTVARAVILPDADNVHSLMKYDPDIRTAQFYAAIFRWINNHSNAVEVCNRFEQEPELMLHKALCNLPTDVEQGVKSIAKAIARNPQQPLYFVVAALLAEESGDYNGALAEMEKALKIWDNEPEWYFIAARYADLLDQPQKSLELYRKSAHFDNGNGKYVLAYGYALIDAGQADVAVNVLEGVNPELLTSEELRIALGNAYLKSGNASKAEEIAKNLEGLDCKNADFLILVSQLAYREGKDEIALEKARQAINADPQSAAAIYYNVQLLRSLDRPVEALSSLEQHLQYVSDLPEFMLLHAELVYEVDGAVAALPLVENLNTLNNKSLRTVKLMAKVYNECGQADQFTAIALEGLKINSGDPDLNLWLGKAQSKTGHLDQAVQHYAEAIRQTPENADAYLELAELFKKRREEMQSIHILRKAIEVFPEDYRAYHAAGNILKEMKDYAGAETMLRRAVELAPNNLAIRRQLGAIIALNLVHQV